MARMRRRGNASKSNGNIQNRSRRPSPANSILRRFPASHQTILQLQRQVGNRATVAYLQRQDEEGSVTVAGAASVSEGAYDEESYSKRLTEERGQDKTPTEKELSETLKKESRQTLYQPDQFKSQHPSLAQIGVRPAEIKGKKIGIYVGNENYKDEESWGTLSGAARDTENVKSTMEGHGYKTTKYAKDRDAEGIASTFKNGMAKAKKGDGVLLYYAGHGVPGGVVGINSTVEPPSGGAEPAQNQEEGSRGVKLVKAKEKLKTVSYKGMNITDVKKYASLVKPLEVGASQGIHSSMIIDACHSGSATDLVRQKAVEKLGEGDDSKVKAVTSQIKRLEDMKKQTPKGEAGGEGEKRGFKLVEGPITLEEKTKSAAEQYWQKVVRPELLQVEAYLKEAGFGITVPERPGQFSAEGIEQQINVFINQLVDLGEQITKEGKKSVLEKVP